MRTAERLARQLAKATTQRIDQELQKDLRSVIEYMPAAQTPREVRAAWERKKRAEKIAHDADKVIASHGYYTYESGMTKGTYRRNNCDPERTAFRGKAQRRKEAIEILLANVTIDTIGVTGKAEKTLITTFRSALDKI